MPDDSINNVYRILDASVNRAGEGMRTLEEFARFVINDTKRSAAWKNLRHELTIATQPFARFRRLASRDTDGDVGTKIGNVTEYRRESLQSIVAAAASRVQQSLRSIEEYGKTIDPAATAQIEQIRYRCYSLSAELELMTISPGRRDRCARSHLYALIDCGSDSETFIQRIKLLAEAGVDMFQLRDPPADDRLLLERAIAGTKVANQCDALLIVNDRPDIAAAAGADGVHVGQQELPVAAARQIVGSSALIGVSTHSIDQARQAVADGADYIGCGPVFPSRTKYFDEYPGIKFLETIAREIQVPSFAIGGIDLGNVDEVLATGFMRVAVTGAITHADDPIATARKLKEKLKP